MWEEGHVNRLRLLQDKPDPLSLLISHKLSTPTGLWSLLLSLYQKYFKRYHSTDIAMGILQILKEMGIPDHLICLLRNLYAGQEATVRTGHGTTHWFQIGKGVCQGCILSPCLFNLYAEYIMRYAGLEETQAGIKIARRNINNLRYADDTTLMAESEVELHLKRN